MMMMKAEVEGVGAVYHLFPFSLNHNPISISLALMMSTYSTALIPLIPNQCRLGRLWWVADRAAAPASKVLSVMSESHLLHHLSYQHHTMPAPALPEVASAKKLMEQRASKLSGFSSAFNNSFLKLIEADRVDGKGVAIFRMQNQENLDNGSSNVHGGAVATMVDLFSSFCVSKVANSQGDALAHRSKSRREGLRCSVLYLRLCLLSFSVRTYLIDVATLASRYR